MTVPTPALKPDYAAYLSERRSVLTKKLGQIFIAESRAPIVFEIGCGHGHFLVAYGKEHPATQCLGIDLIGERIERAEKKRIRSRLPHVHFIQADAEETLEALPVATTIETVFILFPDPWPKRRHHKNRIMQADFLTKLAQRCTAGGTLCFRTDDLRYFKAAEALLSDHPAWNLNPAGIWSFEEPTVFQSRAPSFHSLTASKKHPSKSG